MLKTLSVLIGRKDQMDLFLPCSSPYYGSMGIIDVIC